MRAVAHASRETIASRQGWPIPWALREKRRIRVHLLGAERIARANRPVVGRMAAINRALLLDELRHYRERGQFPHNHVRAGRDIPVFVDEHGTRCAVAHLMEASGQGELVGHIARTRNYQCVRELARLPMLRAWLAAAGLSPEEAARIQPSYCYYIEAEACFCQQVPTTGLALGTVLDSDQGVLQVRIERIEGTFPGLVVGETRPVQGNRDEQDGRGGRVTLD